MQKLNELIKMFNCFMTGSVTYGNQSFDLLSKLTDWFLYDRNLRHERVKAWEERLKQREY